MIDWPSSLIKEIARRRCILFLGAGVSATSKTSDGTRPKDWESFLIEANKLVKKQDKKDQIFDLIQKRNYLLALQAIVNSATPSDYHEFLNENFNNPKFEPSKIHEIIFGLDARIVITTNFDKIYDNYCVQQSSIGFKIITYDSGSIVDEIRSDTYLIIKAHGTIDNINNMIFTKSKYHEAKRDYSNFYEVLKALFITNTVIFIGCSLTDPDVCLLLEDVKIIGKSSKPHFAIIKKGEHNFILEDWKETYNIEAIEYESDHENLIEELNTLSKLVEEERFKFCQ
jgi:NAD-dependent SIR2 family protein deacetylase